MEKLQQTLTDLFTKTIKAHHHAYEEVDGFDPQWCEWYADHIRDEFNQAAGKDFTTEQLTQFFIDANKAYLASDQSVKWQVFYAQLAIEKYINLGENE